MAYDEGLAYRIRDLLDEAPGLTEKAMFGGLSFLVHGNMSVGIIKEDLCVRLSKAENDEALSHPHTRPMDFTKRPMKGWIFVSPDGTADDSVLEYWVERGVAHARSLPKK
jgi:TfoX/Sxy family transcriptional regulator of competence genes